MKKMDIRTRFTQKAIKDSLIELMKTTPIRDVPIKAICADAGVSRSTFYVYYDDQYDVLKAIHEEMLINFDTEYGRQLSQESLSSGLEKTLRYIADNHDSIQVVLSENGDINFQKKFFEEHVMVLVKEMKRALGSPEDDKIERSRIVFFVYGALAMLQDWIKHGLDIPIPQMVKLCSRLINGIFR